MYPMASPVWSGTNAAGLQFSQTELLPGPAGGLRSEQIMQFLSRWSLGCEVWLSEKP